MTKFIPKKMEKEIVSVRLPLETLAIVDAKAAEIGISRKPPKSESPAINSSTSASNTHWPTWRRNPAINHKNRPASAQSGFFVCEFSCA